MEIIPANPGDLGHYDISGYTLESIVFLDASLSLRFSDRQDANRGFTIQLEEVIAYNTWIKSNRFSLLRVDNGGTTYGFDISIRLKQPDLKEYMVLYLFEDEHHTHVLFRGLAKKISIAYFN